VGLGPRRGVGRRLGVGPRRGECQDRRADVRRAAQPPGRLDHGAAGTAAAGAAAQADRQSIRDRPGTLSVVPVRRREQSGLWGSEVCSPAGRSGVVQWVDDLKSALILASAFAVAGAATVPLLLPLLPEEARSLPLPVPVFCSVLAVQLVVVYGLLAFAGLRLARRQGLEPAPSLSTLW